MTVWVDPKAALPLLVESVGSIGSNSLKTTFSEIRLGAPLDDALFSLEIPRGYTLQKAPELSITPEEAVVRDCAGSPATPVGISRLASTTQPFSTKRACQSPRRGRPKALSINEKTTNSPWRADKFSSFRLRSRTATAIRPTGSSSAMPARSSFGTSRKVRPSTEWFTVTCTWGT